MRIRYPEEIEQLKSIYKPYMDGCHLIEGAPKEAVEALDKFKKWLKEVSGDWQ